MAFGIKCLNSATSSVQVDETYKNLTYTGKYTVATADYYEGQQPQDTANTTQVSYIDLNLGTTGTPFIAFNPAYNWVVLPTNWDGTTTTYQTMIEAPNGTSVEYYVFNEPPAISSPSGTGVLIRNAAGEPTFYHDYRYLKVVDVISAADYTTSGFSYSIPGGKTYAIMPLAFPIKAIQYQEGSAPAPLTRYRTQRWGYFVRNTGSAFTSTFKKYYDSRDAYFNNSANFDMNVDIRSYTIMVIDVTGY
ncbi:hypothetical protein K7W03_20520 [Sphingobium sp. PNB]|uniref:hypothetical protein n=1 Tax=Sphingobium sp. PNB TaxID=863934 RepID=UPI001CA46A91|nr:hypothetical protein [Sphingobium sp. PNB]MCB4861980.1 hypothetical protein [Sphingobium sp. PNB]